MTPPEDSGLLAWAFDHAWTAVLALVGVVWKQGQSAMKAQKVEMDRALKSHEDEDQRTFGRVHEEQNMQRNHIAKLFEKIEQHGMRAEDRHHELLTALHEGLSSKADK